MRAFFSLHPFHPFHPHHPFHPDSVARPVSDVKTLLVSDVKTLLAMLKRC